MQNMTEILILLLVWASQIRLEKISNPTIRVYIREER
jgi:hypothetical protein